MHNSNKGITFTSSITTKLLCRSKIMKNLVKTLVVLVVGITLVTLIFKNAPKGNDYIQWEREMIASGQIEANQ